MGTAALNATLLVASLVAGCANYVEGRVEGAVLEALPQVLGPADRYEATVRGTNSNASHFDRVHAVGIRVQRPRTPMIDRIEVDLQDVSVDRPNKQVTGIGAAQTVVCVKSADLTSFLGQQNWIAQPSIH